ncbi:MAG: nucleotidyl transferase AbiEii/AbiGii toxin family protein [Planctomycetes bacterium]|nr:nucleotidyl transferase AbiEii/AbiGii toxin family protein [Planctomycetota bacterium]
MITYEQRLDRDVWWAFKEGSMHFEKSNAVHETLKRIARRLDELKIPYAIAGGMALFFHGVRRFTEDVDILVARDGLQEIHKRLEGLGYLPLFTGSKNLRDTDSGVRIEFLLTGDYPGDGLPKPIAFPDPAEASTEIDGVHFLQLPRLVELKLASGMTNPRRGQDLVDVQRIIETLNLPEDFAAQLHPFVQEKYKEMWTVVHSNPP